MISIILPLSTRKIKLSIHSLLHKLNITKPLVIDAKFEQFIKIEIILHQEINVARIELHISLFHDCARWKHIEIKCSSDITRSTMVPFKSGNSYLERVHSGTTVLDLLILVLDSIIVISFVIITNSET